MKITVHKNFNPWYYSYYLRGLNELSQNITFDRLITPREEEDVFASFPKDYFVFKVQEHGLERLIVIGSDDKKDFSKILYDQSDVFGKVNTDNGLLLKYKKLVCLGPNFGIGDIDKIVLKSLFKQLHEKSFNFDEWRKVFKRSSYATYDSINRNFATRENYLFYLNFPWKKHSDLTTFRKEIIIQLQELEKESVFKFEGGFSKRRLGYFEGLKPYSTNKVYSHKAYLRNIKKSQVVINTPAVHACLGWKLGEYLKLGKAILSFPIGNAMPGEFTVGKHYHQVEDIKKISDELQYLYKNDAYRNSLERNALAYFNEYLSPTKVVSRLIDKAFL